MKFVEDIRNCIDFFIREKTKISRKNYFVEPENCNNLFNAEILESETELKNKYNFEILNSGMSVQNYKENLYVLDILDKYFEVDFKDEMSVLDIGSKNWYYAKGEYIFFKNKCEKLSLNGIEIDAYRLCSNFYSREEIAKFHIKDLKNVNYYTQDFLTYNEKMDYMIWVLPFVCENPHVKWGLPLKYFMPKKMLWHAYFSLKEKGRLFIINQGEDEFEIQKNLLEECAIPYFEIGELKSKFSCYNHKRYGLVVIKRGPDDRIEYI